jgi:hypothetical protein
MKEKELIEFYYGQLIKDIPLTTMTWYTEFCDYITRPTTLDERDSAKLKRVDEIQIHYVCDGCLCHAPIEEDIKTFHISFNHDTPDHVRNMVLKKYKRMLDKGTYDFNYHFYRVYELWNKIDFPDLK